MSDTLVVGLLALASLWWVVTRRNTEYNRRHGTRSPWGGGWPWGGDQRITERLAPSPRDTASTPPKPPTKPPAAKPALMPTVFGRDVDVALTRVMESISKPVDGSERPKQDIPYDQEEVKKVMASVVSAINAATPPGGTPLDLHLVSVDAARKTSDAYKTVSYEGYVTAYSQRRNVAVKLFVLVDVTASGVMVPRRLVQSSAAATDNGGILAAGDVDALAPFEPALRF